MKNFKKTLALALAAAVTATTVFVAAPADAQAKSKTPTVTVTVAKKAKTTKATLTGKGATMSIVTKLSKKKTLKATKAKYAVDKKAKKCVTVSKKGVITAKAAGTGKITVSSGKKKAIIAVTVKNAATKKVALSKTKASLVVGKSLTLKATVTPSNTFDKVTWSSNKPKIASVKNGKVTALAAGTAKITATSGKKSQTATITVTKPAVATTALTVKYGSTTIVSGKTAVSVTAGKSITLTATRKPANTTDTLTWATSDKTVATVSNGKVTGVKAGQAKITAKSGSKSVVTIVNVSAATVTPATKAVTSVTVAPASAHVKAGESQQLTATVLPADATNKAVTWESEDDSAVTVSNTGLVSVKSNAAIGETYDITATSNSNKSVSGKATIRVIAPNVASIRVKLADTAIIPEETTTATVVITPATAVKDVTWTSSDESVATIAEDGTITGVTEGETTITATSTYTEGKVATAKLTVKPPKTDAVVDSEDSFSYKLMKDVQYWNVEEGDLSYEIVPEDAEKDANDLALLTNSTWTTETVYEILCNKSFADSTVIGGVLSSGFIGKTSTVKDVQVKDYEGFTSQDSAHTLIGDGWWTWGPNCSSLDYDMSEDGLYAFKMDAVSTPGADLDMMVEVYVPKDKDENGAEIAGSGYYLSTLTNNEAWFAEKAKYDADTGANEDAKDAKIETTLAEGTTIRNNVGDKMLVTVERKGQDITVTYYNNNKLWQQFVATDTNFPAEKPLMVHVVAQFGTYTYQFLKADDPENYPKQLVAGENMITEKTLVYGEDEYKMTIKYNVEGKVADVDVKSEKYDFKITDIKVAEEAADATTHEVSFNIVNDNGTTAYTISIAKDGSSEILKRGDTTIISYKNTEEAYELEFNKEFVSNFATNFGYVNIFEGKEVYNNYKKKSA